MSQNWNGQQCRPPLQVLCTSFLVLSSSFDEMFSDSRPYESPLSSLDGHPGPLGEISAERINHSLEYFECEEYCENFCEKCVEKRNAHLKRRRRLSRWKLIPLDELNIEDYKWLGKGFKEMGNKRFYRRIGEGEW
jgi:hypothetical protein